jgi:glycerol uptake facilitator-like aquaporin
MVMVYMGGHVSGAHYNPAVSLAATIRGALPSSQYVPYAVVQIGGALAASIVVYVITGRTFAPAPAPDASVVGALLVEILYTFALVLVVLNAAVAKKTQGNSFYGLVIGFTVASAAFAGGGISGGRSTRRSASAPLSSTRPLAADPGARSGSTSLVRSPAARSRPPCSASRKDRSLLHGVVR